MQLEIMTMHRKSTIDWLIISRNCETKTIYFATSVVYSMLKI